MIYLYDSRLCESNAVLSVIQIVHRNGGLKCLYHLPLPKCLLLSLVLHLHSNIYISESSVETHLRCGKMHNNHIIANCPQSVPVKEF